MRGQLCQTDYRLNTDINREGCLFRSLTAMAEFDAARPFTPSEILNIWLECVDERYLATRPGKPGYFVEKPDEVLKTAWRFAGLKSRPPRQIGTRAMHPSAEAQAWGTTAKARYTVLKGATSRGNSHFRLASAAGVEIFEPRPQTEIAFEERVDYYG